MGSLIEEQEYKDQLIEQLVKFNTSKFYKIDERAIRSLVTDGISHARFNLRSIGKFFDISRISDFLTVQNNRFYLNEADAETYILIHLL